MTAITAPGVVDSKTHESGSADENISAFDSSPAGTQRNQKSNNDPRQQGGKQPRQGNQPRRDKRDVHGWVVLDKPVGMTSTHAVAVVKRLFQAKRAGHAGTLDPLASGGLPIAMGEATKT